MVCIMHDNDFMLPKWWVKEVMTKVNNVILKGNKKSLYSMPNITHLVYNANRGLQKILKILV